MGRPLDERPLRFIDCETLGLRDEDPIVELAIVDGDGRVLFDRKIKAPPRSRPEGDDRPVYDLSEAAPWAIYNSGYLDNCGQIPKKYRIAGELPLYADEIQEHLLGAQVWGHSVWFDMRRLKHWFDRYGIDYSPKLGVPCFGTETLVAEHLPWIQGGSLDRARKVLGIDTGRAHTAVADAKACYEIHRRLCRAGPLDRWLFQSRCPDEEKAR